MAQTTDATAWTSGTGTTYVSVTNTGSAPRDAATAHAAMIEHLIEAYGGEPRDTEARLRRILKLEVVKTTLFRTTYMRVD